MNAKKKARLIELRQERSSLVGLLVQARNKKDELAPYRCGNLEREVARVNADIARLEGRETA